MTEFFKQGVYPYLCRWWHTQTDAAAYGVLAACIAAACLAGYLLGSINSAVILSRLVWHDDIRRHGSGNAGTTNMLRTYGKGAALLTLLGDILKTVLAVFLAFCLTGSGRVACGFSWGVSSVGAYGAALFCVVGHIFPLYAHFRGGKGVLCAATAVAVLSPAVFPLVLIVFLATVAFTRYVSLGSVVSACAYPLFLTGFMRMIGLPIPFNIPLAAILIAVLIVYMHRTNIARLRAGEENKLSFRRKRREPENAGADGGAHAVGPTQGGDGEPDVREEEPK